MNISSSGLKLIVEQEGLSLHIYDDAAGFPTIGIGHRITSEDPDYSAGITTGQAMIILSNDLIPVEAAVNRLVANVTVPPVTQNQFDALCDFGFNLGVGALAKMLSHGWSQVPAQILRWNEADGKVLPDLVARRQAELSLFQS